MNNNSIEGMGQLCAPRSCKSSEAIAWFKRALTISRTGFFVWLLMAFVIVMVIVVLPMVFQLLGKPAGMVANLLLTCVAQILFAGFAIAAHRCEQQRMMNLDWLFEGFKITFKPLILLGVVSFFFVLSADELCQWLLKVNGAGYLDKILTAENVNTVNELLKNTQAKYEFFVYIAAVMALTISFNMIFGFAPALIAFHGLSLQSALKMSAQGFFKNIPAFVVYGFLWLSLCAAAGVAASILGTILLAVLGKLAVFIVLAITFFGVMIFTWVSTYTAFSDIFWVRDSELAA